MLEKSFRLVSADGPEVFVRGWLPDGKVRASVLIAHGAAEHGARYARVAGVLTEAGYAVYAPDHRGHGQTAGTLDRAGNAGIDGFNGIIRDLNQLSIRVRAEHSAPQFLLGHSMGAALSQRFVELHGGGLHGVVLSGSPGVRPNLEQAAAYTRQLAQGHNAEQVSDLFRQSFATYNDGFGNERPGDAPTGYEWLSRDTAEVRKYVDDAWCGFPFTNRLVADMSQCALDASRPENVERIPKSLPVFLFSGSDDRVGGNGEFVKKLAKLYMDAGIADVQLKLYPGGRHEMLNEINRDEVHRDLLAWLDHQMRC